MKTTLLIFLGFIFTNFANAQSLQVRIEVTYKEISPLFTKEISNKTSNLVMPTVTTKSGNTAVINIIREFRFQIGPKKWETLNSGATFELTPVINGHQINILGKSTLIYGEPGKNVNQVSSNTFVTHETFVKGTLEDGKATLIKTNNKESIIVKATLLDMEGKPAFPNE